MSIDFQATPGKHQLAQDDCSCKTKILRKDSEISPTDGVSWVKIPHNPTFQKTGNLNGDFLNFVPPAIVEIYIVAATDHLINFSERIGKREAEKTKKHYILFIRISLDATLPA